MNKENNAPMQGNINGIDRQSYEPAYIQLVNILKQHVSSGIMRPGDRLSFRVAVVPAMPRSVP